MSNDIVYHYCSVETFISIIKSNTLRLSDVSKMNDSKEQSWIRDMIYKEAMNRLSYDKMGSEIFEQFWNHNEIIHSRYNAFAVCFSEEGDLLSQWRGYGQDGYGIAIGLSIKEIKARVMMFISVFGKVIYDENKQKKYVDKIVDGFNDNPISYDICNFFSNEIINMLFYKNPYFKAENEWRLVHYDTSIGVRTPNRGLAVGKFNFGDIKINTDGQRIIPYVELNFEDIKDQLIKKIVIGPKSKVSKQDVQILLNNNDYNFDIDNIIKSKGSYI